MPTTTPNWHVIHLQEASSTNTLILQNSAWLNTLGLVLRADHQTAGRGTRGQTWASAPGKQLQFSVVLRPPKGQGQLMALLAGLAVVLAIEEHFGSCLPANHARLKWPNDVHLGGRKCAGILIESAKAQNGHTHLVVGIGVNCLGQQSDFPAQLQPHLTTLQAESGMAVEPSRLMHSVLHSLDSWQQRLAQGHTPALIQTWLAHSNLPQTVRVKRPQGLVTGSARGISQDGFLLVQPQSGEEPLVVVSSSQVAWGTVEKTHYPSGNHPKSKVFSNQPMGICVIGLTGGVACGKSTLAQYLAQQGAAVLNADALGHAVLEQEGKQALVEAFGTDILDGTGQIARPKLGSVVFADANKLNILNAITHPHIAKRAAQQIKQWQAQAVEHSTNAPKAIVLEAALLLETGWNTLCDVVWSVESSPELALQRLRERNQLSTQQATQRIAAQWSPQKRIALADVTIRNTGSLKAMQQQALQHFRLQTNA